MREIRDNTQVQNTTSGKTDGRKFRFIIAGGGTGGHIFPAIAIANAIRRTQPEATILFVGAKGKMEMERVPEAGYEIKGLNIAGYNRSSLIKNVWLPFKLVRSFFQVRQIINQFKPDAVIGVGGYSSFPVLRFAQKKGIPTFIHESNSFAGKSNILLGKKATRIYVAGDNMSKFFPQEKILITGNPVRKIITDSKLTQSEALDFFGLNKQKPVVLILGGSLGAKSINEVIVMHLPELKQMNLQLIWQTGKTRSDLYVTRGKRFNDCVWVSEFIVEMDKAYAAADIVVSRAGAMAVSELCVAAKPVIFVPYPYAAEDHQTVNAQYLVDKNAAILIPDNEARSRLFTSIVELTRNTGLREGLEKNISKLAIKDAGDRIAKDIIDYLAKY